MSHTGSTYQKDCVFCKIAAGELPSFKVWEDEEHIAFLSIFPNTEGFTVVATKNHQPSYAFANDDKVLVKMVLAAKKVGLLIDAAYEDVGRTGMFFEGFGVDHFHAKLFPMHQTGSMNQWQPISSGREEFYHQYPGYLSSHDSKRADDKWLAGVAAKIKAAEKDVKGGV